jgi:hypothetical protein
VIAEQDLETYVGRFMVEQWYSDGPRESLVMNTAIVDRRLDVQAVTNHIADDRLGFYSSGQEPDYRRVAELVQLSKEDLSKIAKVAKSSVRFDESIPTTVAERLREIANIANLVAEFFDGDVRKVKLWFELPNPQLGNISPRNLIRADRYKRLLNFVLEARAAEAAAAHVRTES